MPGNSYKLRVIRINTQHRYMKNILKTSGQEKNQTDSSDNRFFGCEANNNVS